MKIKEGFVLREIADTWVVVPVANRVVEFNGLMNLSESGAFLWKLMEEEASEEELVAKLISEYDDVDESTVRNDVQEFISEVKKRGLLE